MRKEKIDSINDISTSSDPFLSYHNRVHTICGTRNGNEQEMDDFSYREVGRVEKASLPFLSSP